MACTSIAANWGNLPMRSFYLPLLQRLSVYLASTVYPPHNLDTGHAISAFLPVADAGKKATLTTPNGGVVELPIVKKGNRAVVEYSRTQQPGPLPPANAGRGAGALRGECLAPRERSAEALARGDRGLCAAARRHHRAQRRGVSAKRASAPLRPRDLEADALGCCCVLSFAELILQQRFAGIRRRATA